MGVTRQRVYFSVLPNGQANGHGVRCLLCHQDAIYREGGTIKATAPRLRRENQNADVGSFLLTELQGDISLGELATMLWTRQMYLFPL